MEAGKYDDMVNAVQWKTKGQFVAVIVIGGTRGNGFSVSAVPELVRLMPNVLRQLADHIEAGGT